VCQFSPVCMGAVGKRRAGGLWDVRSKQVTLTRRVDWRLVADRFLGPDYLFPLTLWLVVDRGSPSWGGLLVVAGLSLITLGIPKIAYRVLRNQGTLSEAGLRTRPGRLNPWVIGPLVACLVLPLLMLLLFFPDRGILVFYAALLAMVLVAFGLMFRLKVSGHAMASAAFVVVAFFYTNGWGWVFLPLMLIICASRVVLGAHTVREVLVGALVGLTVPTVIFWLLL